jgi:hypothetical protein
LRSIVSFYGAQHTRLENVLVKLDYWIGETFSLLNWLFFHTIYGMLGVAILVYLLFRDLRKTGVHP